MQAYFDQKRDVVNAIDKLEVKNCYSVLHQALCNYASLYIGDYVSRSNSVDDSYLISHIKNEIKRKIKQNKNYTGDDKEELKELYRSSLVDIRNIEYMLKYLSKLMFIYSFQESYAGKDTIYPGLEEDLKDEFNYFDKEEDFECYSTLKDDCDHSFYEPKYTKFTEFCPEDPKDSKNFKGEFYTSTFKKLYCRCCNGEKKELISRSIEPKLDWDLKSQEIFEHTRSLKKNK